MTNLGKHDAMVQALANLRPGCEWTLRGTTYASLEWLDVKQAAPTEREIEAEMERIREVRARPGGGG